MPDEIYFEHQKLDGSPYIMNVDTSDFPARANSADTYVSKGFHKLGDGKEALNVYYNSYWETIAVTVLSDSERPNRGDFFTSGRVYSGKIDFEVSKKNGLCHVFFERFNHIPDGGTTSLGSYLNTILLELFTNAVPLPGAWNVINAICTSIHGSISRDPIGMNPTKTLAYVDAKVSSGNFDQAPLAAAVVMDVDGGNTDSCHLKITASIRYVCTHLKDIYYINSGDMCVETDLTVTV